MATISELKDLFSEWIATVARAVDTIAGRFLRSREILLREGKDDMLVAKAIPVRDAPALPEVSFRLDKGRPTRPLPGDWRTAFRGSRVEAVLQSDHVMFSPLDFPSQAGDFLDGMLREQVDRLTPWTVKEAIFGWSQPTNTANDRIEVTFAATSKLKIQPLLQLAQALDVRSIAIFATASGSEGTATRIKLFDELQLSAIGRTVNVPRILRAVLLSAGLAAAASLLVTAYLGSSLQSEQQELQRRISQRRAALRLDPNAGGSGEAQADNAVERHGTGSRLPGTARLHLRNGVADRGRQDPSRRHDAGCSLFDPLDGAVAAVHPCHFLCAHHARAERAGRAVPHRGAYHGLFWIRHMSTFVASGKANARSPLLSATIYAGLVVVLLFAVVTSIADVAGQRDEVASLAAMLAQLEGHNPTAVRGPSSDVTMPSGSPFLEGATVTIAGATLLQRVSGAVTKFGGNVLSTQLDLQGTQSRTGFLSMIASCEIDQPELQRLLYDLEAGMPFLFIDQLVVQTALTSSGSGGGRLRILLAVSGQWPGAK